MAEGFSYLRQVRTIRFVFVPLRRVIEGCASVTTDHQNTATPASNGGFSPGVHLFPFRTEPLSPGAPMVLPSPVGESVAANLLQGKSLLDAFTGNQEGFLPLRPNRTGAVCISVLVFCKRIHIYFICASFSRTL